MTLNFTESVVQDHNHIVIIQSIGKDDKILFRHALCKGTSQKLIILHCTCTINTLIYSIHYKSRLETKRKIHVTANFVIKIWEASGVPNRANLNTCTWHKTNFANLGKIFLFEILIRMKNFMKPVFYPV